MLLSIERFIIAKGQPTTTDNDLEGEINDPQQHTPKVEQKLP